MPGLISAMILVGENEPYLKYCIDSVKEIADEIVFLKIATGENVNRHFTDEERKDIKVLWQEGDETDFAEWRNRCIKESSGDWILMIDADEIFAKHDGSNLTRSELESLIINAENINSHSISFFTRHFIYNYFTTDGRSNGFHFTHNRLFKKSKHLKFSGKVHEKLVGNYLNPMSIFNPMIWHFGHCKGMEDLRNKYSKYRETNDPNDPFREERMKYKTNDEFCSRHDLFRGFRPFQFYFGPLPKVMKLW